LETITKNKNSYWHNAYIIAIIILASSLTLSRFGMSISQFLLLFLWLFYPVAGNASSYETSNNGKKTIVDFLKGVKSNVSYRSRKFYNNKPALIVASVYFMHLIGLLYTSNFNYAAKDLRIKLPLLLLPVIFSSMPKLSFKELKRIFVFYLGGLTIAIVIGLNLYLKGEYSDVRDLSHFISPIRFSLNLVFGILIMAYFVIYDKTISVLPKILSGTGIVVFFYFMIIIESITGIFSLLIVISVLLIVLLFRIKRLYVKVLIISTIILVPIAIVIYTFSVVKHATKAPSVDISKLPVKTEKGNRYNHNLKLGIENGKYVGLYVCEKELREEWNKRSKLDYDGKSYNGDNLKEIIIRYLTSKGLKKDASGIDSLSNQDIKNIEEGIANIEYIENPGFRSRILKVIIGYERYMKSGDPSGNSIMQRVEYLRGSMRLISKHWLFGVGTGDFQDELYNKYKEMNSKLKSNFIFHPHNQFVSITIMFGVFGLIWFVFSLFYPPFKINYYDDFFFLTFFVLIILSMFSDDTLDTQAGATLFSFFYNLLLFARKEKKTLYLS
jgi:hypothetical protein